MSLYHRGGPGARGRIGNIELNRESPAAGTLNLVGHRLCCPGAFMESHGDTMSPPGQLLRDRFANAA